MPSAPAPGGHEGLTPPSKLSGELDREIKEGSFAGPLLGVLSSTGVSSVSGLGLTEEKKRQSASALKEELKCHALRFTPTHQNLM